MEEQKSIVFVIIACSIVAVAIGIGFILFIIQQRRQRHKYESVIEILEAQKDLDIQKLQREVGNIKEEMKAVKDKIETFGSNK